MCTVCGCSGDDSKIDTGHPHDHANDHGHAHAAADGHGHHHDHAHDGDVLDYGAGPARAHAPGLSQARMVEIERGILSKNDGFAATNRARLKQAGVLALNMLAGPGAGKTTLLVETLRRLGQQVQAAVIEGDQQTSNDAERIRATGAPAIQVNTGKGCHLDAHMVGHAMAHLPLVAGSLLFIENVGNLVCPAAFDLGEHLRVTLLSVTEGEDKPLKYPDIFQNADLVVLTKTDLLPHLDVDIALLEANVARVAPTARILHVSTRSGAGMERGSTGCAPGAAPCLRTSRRRRKRMPPHCARRSRL
ncbi:hydrogenase nickel incorporation protein HypB [Komagataeibacter kakiaceti]|uniref:hydrogenase nickel incorporation protein HypB n=1 Tax=Komagataeibacter kakiaceti TaxID=943261 RepID=UPI000A5FFBF6|nr:hydrogenase nickel incorporation protein HypB [Komagataeibacter kakiaceti]